MSIKSGLIAFLIDNGPLAQLAGDRIRFGRSPATDILPRINIMQVDADHKEHMAAAAGHAQGRFQFDCYAKTPKQAQQLADALREALHGYRGRAGDTWISTAHLTDERDTFIEPHEGDDAEDGIDGIQQDYTLAWKTSIPTF